MDGKCRYWRNSGNYCVRGGRPMLGCYPDLMERWGIGGPESYEVCPTYNGLRIPELSPLIDPRLASLEERPKQSIW